MPYKITRSESYKADQIKSGSSLKHYGRKGMKWGKEIFGEDDIPGQSRSSSSGAPPSKALASVLNTRVTAPRLLNSTYTNPITRKDAQKTNASIRNNPGLPLARTPSPNKVQIAGGSSELVKKQTEEPKKDTRNGLQKWFDQAGKDIGKAAGDVKNWGEGAVNDTKKWVEGATNDTKKWADQAGKDIGRAVKTTKNSVEKTVTDAIRGTGQWVERTANDAKEWTDNAIKDVSKAAVKVGDGAKDAVNWLDDTVHGGAERWVNNAIKDIGKTAVKIGDDAKKAYGDAEKWVNGAIKDVGKAAVKVGDDAKKAYGDAEKWVNTAIGDTKKWVEGAANDTKKWGDQAGKDIGRAAKTAYSKGKDIYERITDTGTQRLLNPKHMTVRQRINEDARKKTAKGVANNVKEGRGPRVSKDDAAAAANKIYGRGVYGFNGTDLNIATAPYYSRTTLPTPPKSVHSERSSSIVKKTPSKTGLIGPSGSDAKKYLQGQGLKVYQDTVKQLSKNPNDMLARAEMEFFKNTIDNRKREERDKR